LSSQLTRAVTFVLITSVVACGSKGKNSERATLLKDSSRLLENLSRRSGNTIPDAVLNRTKCLVVTPAMAGDRIRGIATCRQTPDQWNHPAFITFESQADRAHGADRLIFILQDGAVRALQSGRLQVRPRRQETPLVSTNPVPNQVEISGELLVYEYSGNALSGSRAIGLVEQGDRASGEVPDKLIRKYLSSVVSLFNTIIPTGIVIHHTAVIPSENALPRNEHDVDKYHQTRGFEITCFGHVYHAAYHYLILPDGHVQAGRPEKCEGAHAEGYNSYLGISLVGDFSSKDNPDGKKGPNQPTEQQFDSLIQLCRRLRNRYNIPLQHIVRHSDISSTRCPGDRFPFGSLLEQLQTTQATGSNSGIQ
jgi:N-acetylmuramoyl-L-alanine amidase